MHAYIYRDIVARWRKISKEEWSDQVTIGNTFFSIRMHFVIVAIIWYTIVYLKWIRNIQGNTLNNIIHAAYDYSFLFSSPWHFFISLYTFSQPDRTFSLWSGTFKSWHWMEHFLFTFVLILIYLGERSWIYLQINENNWWKMNSWHAQKKNKEPEETWDRVQNWWLIHIVHELISTWLIWLVFSFLWFHFRIIQSMNRCVYKYLNESEEKWNILKEVPFWDSRITFDCKPWAILTAVMLESKYISL